MQADIQHIEEVMNRNNYVFNITPLGGNIPKHERIRRLIPIVEQGRFFIPKRCLYIDNERKQQDFNVDIRTEMREFPVSAHDDVLDMLARITEPALGAEFPFHSEKLEDGDRREHTHTDNSSPHYGFLSSKNSYGQTSRQTFEDVMWRR
jgi:hypothetical protein